MTRQNEIVETKQSEYGPDEQGFYRALMAELAEREALAAKGAVVAVDKVKTPPGAMDAVGMYGGQ